MPRWCSIVIAGPPVGEASTPPTDHEGPTPGVAAVQGSGASRVENNDLGHDRAVCAPLYTLLSSSEIPRSAPSSIAPRRAPLFQIILVFVKQIQESRPPSSIGPHRAQREPPAAPGRVGKRKPGDRSGN